ncbi:hypothetical protein LU699_09555 [Luteimonas fraxinea]|uniref:O-antigen ligase-related domain-containing protein n=2 Tax=Luteimonas fraxinea TaxID=2901869 RepID=A0ABS8UF50_9GAMM|nr:O-antigen ligase family protein [Luteimonas fraxinea]MCD9097679.1 hypothetical protein [Luteimonas fraxinea]UHH08578.1 hypothetical protein LU699_09555 [Luteimonas fraxinea]
MQDETLALDGRSRINLALAGLLLVMAVVTGGSSQQAGTGVMLLQLASLPAIAWVIGQRLAMQGGRWPPLWTALILALLAIPLLQLLPMPAGFVMSDGRALLQQDLAQVGVALPARWTLAPDATRASFFALLPAVAIFGLVFFLPSGAQRALLWGIVALAMASLLLGILQLGAPQESALNPYPQWQPAMSGFFANPNHQATLLVIAATLVSAPLVSALKTTAGPGARRRGVTIAISVFVLLMAMTALPLTGSRAGVILCVLACALVVGLHGAGSRGANRRRLLLLASTVAVSLGLFAALRWMQVDAVDELRSPLRAATVDIAMGHAPAGSGMGSYVGVFEQEAPPAMLMGSYVNHAHNEYVQWLLEAGLPALLVMALGACALAWSARAIWRLPAHRRSAALPAFVALLAVLGHSFVDYPLRTPALLAVMAALAAIVAKAAHAAGTTPAARRSHTLPIKAP